MGQAVETMRKTLFPGTPALILDDVQDLGLAHLRPILYKHGIMRLDSAAVYANGESECQLGAARLGERFAIDAKILANRPVMHSAFQKLQALSNATSILADELSLRWLPFHLALEEGDAVLLGASKTS